MEAHIETLKQQLEDTRVLLMFARSEYFLTAEKDITCEEEAEMLFGLYKEIWGQHTTPDLDEINKYAKTFLAICINGKYYDENNDDGCECDDCEKQYLNTCEKTD